MSTQLASYKATRGSTLYHIIKGGDGVTYCTCPGWKNRRNCKHLLDWTLNKGMSASQRFDVTEVPAGTATDYKFTEDDKMNDAVSMAINMMKG